MVAAMLNLLANNDPQAFPPYQKLGRTGTRALYLCKNDNEVQQEVLDQSMTERA